MDTYSYISENGTVRQIEDLLAKAKNEQQDTEIQANRNAINALSADVSEEFLKCVESTAPQDTQAGSIRDLLEKKVRAAISGGYFKQVGQTVAMAGTYKGVQWGTTLITWQAQTLYTVIFIGTGNMFAGLYDANNDSMTVAVGYDGILV